ncbi:phosphatidylethanolamine-binding protein [Hypoxylon sp. NC1633]|nr:phosphatidylethanolamine-binding protein [Hypoxylon sp. NC1633]
MSLADHAESLTISLSKAHLVPGPAAGLIPASFAPTTKLCVSFGDGSGVKAVDLGTFFRASECKLAPRISFAPEEDAAADAGATYTFILADPDAPTPDDPKAGEAGEEVAVRAANVLTAYLGPGPKDDSKPHRYLPAGVALAKDDVGGEEFVQRRSFNPAEFAEKHGLRLVALNWMTCADDGWTE